MVKIYRNELPPTTLILKAFTKLQSLGHASLQELADNKQAFWTTPDLKRLAEAVGWLLKHGFAKFCSQ